VLASLSLDFRAAPLEVRERLHLADEDVARCRERLAARGACESVVIRTCNRVELYGWWSADRHPAEPARELGRAWMGSSEPGVEELCAVARLRLDADAARHLIRVASGLESQVLGDVQILGQLRRAFSDAREAGRVGPHLHRLFETGLRIGKAVKTTTRLSASRSSVGAEAARRAASRLGGLAGRRCAVVGCGKSGALVARTLAQLGAADLVFVNRTLERAEALARELDAQAEPLSALERVVSHADVVFVSTGAETPLLSAEGVRLARTGRTDRSLLVIDLCVPRNVEVAVGALPGVELLDLDGLSREAADVERARREAVPEAERLVEAGVGQFVEWLDLQSARHALRPVREALGEICRREIAHVAGASALAERVADRIVASFMAHPMTALRGARERRDALEGMAEVLGHLFAGPAAAPRNVSRN
jgi:glutamyl-tRNA reductase